MSEPMPEKKTERMWACMQPLLAALVVFGIVFGLRWAYIPAQDSLLIFNEDEIEMHEAALGPVLGTVPQRLIWPGGIMRYVAQIHLGISALLDDTVPKTADGLATHIGRVLLHPGQAWYCMRLVGALAAAMGFAAPVWLAVRHGVSPLWAGALALATSAFPLHWVHACMVSPDALAWALVLISLTLAWVRSSTSAWLFGSAVVAGVALGCKMTVLPVLPALALAAVAHRQSWARSSVVWGCGLLLGMLVANPYFLADPVRTVKTTVGIIKFKPGSLTGIGDAMRLMFGGIPVWLVLLGWGSAVLAWCRKERGFSVGICLSMFWMINSAAGSKQVMERYYPPLGMIFFFASMIILLPWLQERMGAWARRWGMSCVVILALVYCSVAFSHMRSEMSGKVQRYKDFEHLVSTLTQLEGKRVAVDSSLFGPQLNQLATPASLDALAEHLELSRVGHRSLQPMLVGFGFSPSSVQVLGGLFEEVDVNLAARLRAMAAAAHGHLELRWFFAGSDPAYGRLWMCEQSSVVEALRGGDLDAVVFAGEISAEFDSWKRSGSSSDGRWILIQRDLEPELLQDQ